MNNLDKETGLNDRRLRYCGIPLVALSGLLSLMQFFFQGRWDLFGKYLIASIIYTIVTWEICRQVLIRLRRKIPGLENTGRRLLLSIFYFFIVAGIGNVVVKVILYQMGLKPPSMANKSFFEWWLLNMPNIVFFVLLLSSVYEAIYFFDQYKNALRKTEALKKQQAQKQLDMLKTRVNPHFLFNSLTTLSALISEDARRAERFVDELSRVYRYLLRAGNQRMATLAEELQFADSYAFLLKNRFAEGSFSLKKENTLCVAAIGTSSPETAGPDKNVPVLSLQNALDYFVRTQNVPLHISLDTDQDYLRISCKDAPKNLSFEPQGNDWLLMDGSGVREEIVSGQLTLSIPFSTPNASNE